ncbi:2'-5' RNA ligase family protein [Microbacterium sp. P05]|uniref:2'-5' RNA ligase family protein n=1 Tax=Microbacterium sp. P05 TaxID=3366948 RepID=UPI003746D35A
MSEVTSIELLLDPATEAAVRAEWEALAAAGLSSMAAHTSESNRPHITLLARNGPVEIGGGIGKRMLPLPITLGAPVLFGSGERRVLARSVIPSARLLALHAEVHSSVGDGVDLPHTAPEEWMPHVTLARRARSESLPTALALIGQELHGFALGLRRWDAVARTVTDLG